MVIWDITQQLQLRTLRKSTLFNDRDAAYRDQRQMERADELEDRIEQVLIVTEALYKLCKDRFGVTEEDLRAAVDAVLAEREAKSQADAQPARCSSCGAAVLRDQLRCQYCGTETGHAPELFR